MIGISNLESGYYWVLLLNSGMWQVAKYYKETGIFYLINDLKEYRWENFGQIGEKIPSNYTLYELKTNIE